MDTVPIFKTDVPDRKYFEFLLNLYGCCIASVEDDYYIVEGHPEDVEEFRKYWSEIGVRNG